MVLSCREVQKFYKREAKLILSFALQTLKKLGHENYSRRKSISSLLSLVTLTLNIMQPMVSKIALSPNQPCVDIESPGKFHDDEVSAL